MFSIIVTPDVTPDDAATDFGVFESARSASASLFAIETRAGSVVEMRRSASRNALVAVSISSSARAATPTRRRALAHLGFEVTATDASRSARRANVANKSRSCASRRSAASRSNTAARSFRSEPDVGVDAREGTLSSSGGDARGAARLASSGANVNAVVTC